MNMNTIQKRASIFAFYDAQGIVDDYILHLLKEMRPHCTYQLVVVNGTLAPTMEEKLLQVCDQVHYRENSGYDISAYKDAILHFYPQLQEFDEVLFFNQTVFGPFYPFSQLFESMDNRTLDFWGLTLYKGSTADPDWAKEIGYIPPHLQSYFLAIRKNLFQNPAFFNFFENLPPIQSYFDAVGKFEIVFTKHFADLGFQYQAFVDQSQWADYGDYALISAPVKAIKEAGCPLAKRKSFLIDRTTTNTIDSGNATQHLYEFIKNETSYDFNLIKPNLCRTVDNFTLNYSLTGCFDFENVTVSHEKSEKTGYIVYLPAENMLADIHSMLQPLAEKVSLTVLSPKQDILNAFSFCDTIKTDNPYEFLFHTHWDKLRTFENICYLSNDLPLLNDGGYDTSTLLNYFCLFSQYAALEQQLKQQTDYGVLTGFPAYTATNFVRDAFWSENYAAFSQMIVGLNTPVVMDEVQAPIFCSGGMFFAKTQSIAPLAKLNFADLRTRFPQVFSQLICYLPTIAAQSENYFTGFVFDKQNAYADLLNLDCYLRALKQIAKTPQTTRYDLLTHSLKGRLEHYQQHHNDMTLRQAFEDNLTLKEKLYIIKNLFFYK